MKIKVPYGKFELIREQPRDGFAFRCPRCKSDVRPQNVKCIVCDNCGEAGNTEHFSSVERLAA